MNKVTTLRRPVSRRLRLGVAEAKAQLSAVLRDAAAGPTVIHSRGRDLAVVIAVEDYGRLTAERDAIRRGGALFLDRVDALKARHGERGEDFVPARLRVKIDNPFESRRRAKP